MRKVVVTLEVEPHQYHEGLIEDVLRQIIEEQVLNGETERIVSIEVESHPDDDFSPMVRPFHHPEDDFGNEEE
jgi:hypothetical protein